MKKRVKRHLLSYLAMICSVVSFIIAILNLIFFNSDFLRGVVWSLVFIVMALDFLVLLKWSTREQNENYLLNYENIILRYSYIQMGEYVKHLNIPELNDIERRIENELRDIEIKKKWQAKKLGIKTKEADND